LLFIKLTKSIFETYFGGTIYIYIVLPTTTAFTFVRIYRFVSACPKFPSFFSPLVLYTHSAAAVVSRSRTQANARLIASCYFAGISHVGREKALHLMHKRNSLKLINESLSSQTMMLKIFLMLFHSYLSSNSALFSRLRLFPSKNLLVLVVFQHCIEAREMLAFRKARRKKAFSVLMDCGRDGRNTNFCTIN
jgi:hypothetical protein